ncbi:MAG: YbhB/YbcL family Raf kinase inhibitor-like protein [Syntrophobacterales bacterium]
MRLRVSVLASMLLITLASLNSASAQAKAVKGNPIVIQVVELDYANADHLAVVLTPLLSPEGRIVAYSRTNSLIIKDRASVVKSLVQIIKGPAKTEKGVTAMTLTITSPAFSHNGEIPRRHTCDGEDISPALEWSKLPEETKSLALIVDDPDAPDPAAPKMIWVHWVLYNIPPSVTGLPEGVKPQDLPGGTEEGLNDWKRPGYGGPCPPIGRHRYFHKLYALDVVLPDLGRPTKKDLQKAMAGHILAEAELVGTYQRSR